MTGKDLIEWIQENNAEDMEVLVMWEPWVGDEGEPDPKIRDGVIHLM